jgi:ATP/maltotriose-dependent transcriptional regulator MalT
VSSDIRQAPRLHSTSEPSELSLSLINRKIEIPYESPPLSRSRLLRRLSESLNSCGTTIVTGRAGHGKTMLAADFARRCERDVAWYKVDAPDADLRVFLYYLVMVVARKRPGFGARTLAHFHQSTAAMHLSTLAEAYIYDLQKGDEPLLVVIDDLHLVYDAEWVVPFFHRLLPLVPADVHFLILCRSLPPAPLWRLRSKQSLCVIDESDLTFSALEALALFESYGLGREAAHAALLQSRGHAASLHARAKHGGGRGATT